MCGSFGWFPSIMLVKTAVIPSDLCCLKRVSLRMRWTKVGAQVRSLMARIRITTDAIWPVGLLVPLLNYDGLLLANTFSTHIHFDVPLVTERNVERLLWVRSYNSVSRGSRRRLCRSHCPSYLYARATSLRHFFTETRILPILNILQYTFDICTVT